MKLESYVKKLYKERQKKHQRVNIVSVVADGKRIFGYGVNNYFGMSSVARKNNYWTTHSEIACLNSASQTEGMMIYVYREDKHGKPALAKPCLLCYNILVEYGINMVYYSIAEEPYWERMKI